MRDDELLQLIATLDPIDERELADVEPAPLRRAAEIPARPRRRRVRLARVLVPAGAAAAIAVGWAATLPGDGRSAAAESLHAAARVAEASPPASARYQYARISSATLGTTVEDGRAWSVLLPVTIEQWVAADGSGRIRERDEPAVFPGERDRRLAGGRDGALFRTRTRDQRFAPGAMDARAEPSLPPTTDLPTDVDRLDSVLRDAASGGGVPVDVKTFELVGRVLAHPAATPELCAALYRVAARIDGVEYAGRTLDPRGRASTALAMTSDYSGARTRLTFFFDDRTGRPLAQTSELLEPQPWVDGRQIGYFIVEASGAVDTLDARPR